MSMFSVKLEHLDGEVVVELIGELDLAAREDLRSALRPLAHRYDRGQVTFDCAHLRFVDSTGLLSLVEALRPMAPGATPVLRNLNRAGRRVFDLVGLESFFTLVGAPAESASA
jgi:anti-anti-sigma factor